MAEDVLLSEFCHISFLQSNFKCFISIVINILEQVKWWIAKNCKVCKERNKISISSASAAHLQVFDESQKCTIWFSPVLPGTLTTSAEIIGRKTRQKQILKITRELMW